MRWRYVASLSLATWLTISGRASVLFDSGLNTFAATGTQFDRIARNGNASTWGSVKDFPGTLGDPRARGYKVFVVDSSSFRFLQISLHDPTTGLFVSAYLDSYNPVNVPPNYGLDVKYLGDPGLSQPLGSPSFFQIEVLPHSRIVLVINEINPGAGAGRPFDLIVESFIDASFRDVPEPNSLFAAGVVVRREARKAPVLKGDRPHENPSNPFQKISLCHRSAWIVRRT